MDQPRTNVFEENRKLKEQLDYKIKQANDWQNKYYELVNELKKTQALLRQFLNENTPSSKLPFNQLLTFCITSLLTSKALFSIFIKSFYFYYLLIRNHVYTHLST